MTAATTVIKPAKPSAESSGATRFSIHGCATAEIEAGFPFGQGMKQEFESFASTDRSEPPDVLVTLPGEAHDPRSNASGVYEYTEDTTWIQDFDVAVSLRDGRFRLACRRDPLPFTQPLIQHALLSKGHGLIHAAAIAVSNQGVAIPAWGGTGKTSAIVELTRLPGVSFMSDDYCILSGTGELLSYPKPFFVYPFHRNVFPHLFREKRKALVPTRLLPALRVLREATRPIFMKRPRLESLARRITPEHMKVSARAALPDADFAARAPLRAVLFAGRYSGPETLLEPYDMTNAVRRVVGNWFMELGAPARDLLIGCCATSLCCLDYFIHELQRIVVKAFEGVPIFDLRLPHTLPPDQTGKVMAESVQRVLE